MSAPSSTYSFAGQEVAYNKFRPSWPISFAQYTLLNKGYYRYPDGSWFGDNEGKPPTVVLIGAGTGADAAPFKALGCTVALIEPNSALLTIAKENMERIPAGSADFFCGNAMQTGLPKRSADIIVVAQALHTLKHSFSSQYIPRDLIDNGKGSEELAREHWQIILRKSPHTGVSVWYYNIDPTLPSTHTLHDILRQTCPEYAQSGTPFLNAPYFEPNHFQPWLDKEHMTVSELMPVQTLSISRDQLKGWLSSYSFKPNEESIDRVVSILAKDWFGLYQKNGIIEIPYVGAVTQGPLRPDPFPMLRIDEKISVASPLRTRAIDRSPH